MYLFFYLDFLTSLTLRRVWENNQRWRQTKRTREIFWAYIPMPSSLTDLAQDIAPEHLNSRPNEDAIERARVASSCADHV